MHLSKRAEYAIKALLELCASQEGEGAEVLSLRHISERSDVPLKFLEQIMMALKNARFVKSERGKEGGYVLSRSPRSLTVGEIIRAVDGALAPFGTLEEIQEKLRHEERYAGLYSVLLDARKALSDVLDHTTLSDLCERTREMNQNQKKFQMYYI